MKYTAGQETAKGEFYDCLKDFTVLTPAEKRRVLKTAKALLKLQRENALLADTPVAPTEAGSQV
jgi:hypothetical protein